MEEMLRVKRNKLYDKLKDFQNEFIHRYDVVSKDASKLRFSSLKFMEITNEYFNKDSQDS